MAMGEPMEPVAPVIGTGGIEKIDGGRLIFTASNTYSGLTLIKDGWVDLGNATAEGSFGTGSVMMTGSVSRLVVNRTTDASVLNPISGRGVIELFGTNKVEFGYINMPGPFNGSIILIGEQEDRLPKLLEAIEPHHNASPGLVPLDVMLPQANVDEAPA